MSHEGLHEKIAQLTPKTVDMHRALVSLQEELEAVDWYQQRADACNDPKLKQILLHNMDEEVEHAAMVLEWLRRNHPSFEKNLRTYLFTTAEITDIEEGESSMSAQPGDGATKRSTIGKLGRER